MDRGVPYITLDPATGELVARYQDGTVTRWGEGEFGNASTSTDRSAGTGGRNPIRPISGGTGLSRRGSPAGGGPSANGGYRGDEPIPPPGPGIDIGARLDEARSRLASARARIAAATGGGSGYGGYSGNSSYSSAANDHIPRPDPLHGKYAHGLDQTQAAELTYHPTAMLPLVFPNLNPSDPLYTTLASLPVAQWAQILGNGSIQSTANRIGKLYNQAGMQSNLPSTDKLLNQLRQGGGVKDMFEGVKAGKHDYESYSQPGYVYGQEPLAVGEAATAYGSLLDAALSQEPLMTAQKYGVASGGWGSYMLDKWASKAMKRPPGKGKPVYRYVGKKLFR